MTIEQLSDIAEQVNGTQTNQEKLAELWNKTTELNGQIYYFESGNISQTLGADGNPIGGVPVNQSVLEQMAQEPTYTFNTSYVPLTNVNYSLTITVPQFAMVSYKPEEYPGTVLVARTSDDNQSYVVSTFVGTNDNTLTEEPTNLFTQYDYSYNTKLTSQDSTNYDTNYVFLIKSPITEGFQSNVLSDVVSQASESASTQVGLRLSSYKQVQHSEPAIFKEYEPLFNYTYDNDTFAGILSTVKKFDTFYTPELRNEVLTNISNELMSWAWDWWNASSGYFRNSVKETESVMELHSLLQNYLTNDSKFYFYDLLTTLNTTIDKYTYSTVKNTTTETNVVVATIL